MIEIRATSPVDEAFDTLVRHGVHSVPVTSDDGGGCVGFFDVADMVTHVVHLLHETSAPDGEEVPEFNDLRQLVLGQIVPVVVLRLMLLTVLT